MGKQTPTGSAPKKQTSASKPTSSTASSAVIPAAASPVPIIQEKTLTQMGQIILDEVQSDSDSINYFIIDENERIQAFFRNRDVNYINLMDVGSLKAERVRIAVLSSLRFDKIIVFDLMDNELLIESMMKICSEVSPNLFDQLLNGSIKNENNFTKLIKESDGDQFKPFQFDINHMKHFKVVICFSKPTQNQNLLKLGTPFKIVN